MAIWSTLAFIDSEFMEHYKQDEDKSHPFLLSFLSTAAISGGQGEKFFDIQEQYPSSLLACYIPFGGGQF